MNDVSFARSPRWLQIISMGLATLLACYPISSAFVLGSLAALGTLWGYSPWLIPLAATLGYLGGQLIYTRSELREARLLIEIVKKRAEDAEQRCIDLRRQVPPVQGPPRPPSATGFVRATQIE